MPTYEYACRDCGEHLEVVQSFRDDPLTVCPACEGRLRKVFAAAGIVFKGSGWHIKDYGSTRSRSTRDRDPVESVSVSDSGDSSEKKASSTAAGDSSPEPSEKKSA